jgi:hypothetical protein
MSQRCTTPERLRTYPKCAEIGRGGVTMRANQWRFAALSLLTPVLIAAGIATATDYDCHIRLGLLHLANS